MRRKLSALLIVVLILTLVALPVSAEEVGNIVNVKLSNVYSFGTESDTIDNVPLPMQNQYFIDVVNELDPAHAPLVNPKVELRTGTAIEWFWPNGGFWNFTQQPGIFTWSLNGNINEPAAQAFVAYPANGLRQTPKFSMARTVDSEFLNNGVNYQNVTVTFRLEEPLPPEINSINLFIGDREEVYTDNLVTSKATSQNTVSDWNGNGCYGGAARWVGDLSKVAVGKTYIFKAALESTKLPKLLGKPIYKPMVGVIYSNWERQSTVTSDTITLTNPNLSAEVTVSADSIVDWIPEIESIRYNIMMNSVTYDITKDDDGSYHVLVPADVDIKPETLNLNDTGNGIFTAQIILPSPYSIQDISPDTIKCNGAEVEKYTITENAMSVKFRRQDLNSLQPGAEVEFEVIGSLSDGSIFKGSDKVRINK